MKDNKPTGDAKLDDLTNHVDQIMRRQDLAVNSPRCTGFSPRFACCVMMTSEGSCCTR